MWFGMNDIGRGLYRLLAWGVIFSGIIKDLVCLPRPLSPPLQRITMSGSAALEYGFPSTHTTNAVSVAVWALYRLHTNVTMLPMIKFVLQILAYVYVLSIAFGRLYCGMHGFFDTVIGFGIGLFLALVQVLFGDEYDFWLATGSIWSPLLIAVLMLIIVRTHPEPADDCPCFDDSVAFAGVLIGGEIAVWRYTHSPFSISDPVPGSTPYSLAQVGWIKTIIRVLLGVFFIFTWRATLKPLLFRILPPVFRIIERLSLDIPRRFFLKASQYNTVPPLRRDDNVIPSASDIPNLINSVRQRHGRAVSIGPQSAADAYETIAYRREQRRRSLSGSSEMRPISPVREFSQSEFQSTASHGAGIGTGSLHVAAHKPIQHGSVVRTDIDIQGNSVSDQLEPFPGFDAEYDEAKEEENDRREIFGKLEKVRVKYDVEVVTKLIVYSGIAWLAIEVIPVLFECTGLGAGSRTGVMNG
jgi:hypothetical protein